MGGREILGQECARHRAVWDTATERKFLVGRRDDLGTGRQARHVTSGDMCPKGLMGSPRSQQGAE